MIPPQPPQQMQALEKRITDLENKVKQLTYSSEIPRNVETALTERLPFLTVISTGSATQTTSGAHPTATGVLNVIENGITYKILYQ